MSDKGIYVAINTHVEGEVYDLFISKIQDELRTWLNSDNGHRVITGAVAKAVEDHIRGAFSYGYRDDPKYKKFEEIIRAACLNELLGAVSKK